MLGHDVTEGGEHDRVVTVDHDLVHRGGALAQDVRRPHRAEVIGRRLCAGAQSLSTAALLLPETYSVDLVREQLPDPFRILVGRGRSMKLATTLSVVWSLVELVTMVPFDDSMAHAEAAVLLEDVQQAQVPVELQQ